MRLVLLLSWLTLVFSQSSSYYNPPDTSALNHDNVITIKEASELNNVADYDGHEDVCVIRKNWSMSERCVYVTMNVDSCEGGGYTLWSRYVTCTTHVAARVFVYIGAVIYLIILFLHVSVTADDFFSPNIAAIVAQLQISETVAGVTLLALGNGAPDVFGSIASVLSTPTPKAGLALGALLGGGLFVTTVVLATIILKAKSFRVNIISSFREFLFYAVSVGWILYVFLRGHTVALYEPLVDLGIYFAYVLVVIVFRIVQVRMKQARIERRSLRRSQREASKRTTATPEVEIPETESTEDEEPEDEEEPEVVIVGHHVVSRVEAFNPEPKPEIPRKSTWIWRDTVADTIAHFNPKPDADEWKESNIFEKIFLLVKIPSQLILKMSVPRAEDKWIKPLSMFHLLLAPQLILGALHYWTTTPFHGSPPLFVYGLGLSVMLMTLVLIFTRIDTPPRFYRQFASFLGFLMSIAWIYLASSEIVGVITMIGVATGLSFEFLGLTILAWSNCIGDFVSDLSVIKQGLPRMAFAAATGGPLFNLLVGFGLPFTIATAKGSNVTIDFSTQLRILIIFIFVSILISLIALLIQKFTVTRWHSLALYIVYVIFLVLIILCEAKVIYWQ